MIIQLNNQNMIVRYDEYRLDAAAAPAFRKKLNEQIAMSNPKSVILDLRDVHYIDSSGIGAIIAFFQSLQSKIQLLLCGIGEQIKKLFRSTKLDSIFIPYPDVASALEAVN
jgi:anti-sigma B factor antagonist